MNGLAYVGAALAVCLAAFGLLLVKGLLRAVQWRHCQATGGQRDIRTLILALAFMEALTLFSFVIAILLWTKI